MSPAPSGVAPKDASDGVDNFTITNNILVNYLVIISIWKWSNITK